MRKLLLVLLLCLACPSNAAVLATAASHGLVISVTDEACTLKQVSNLPFRATWRDGRKVYEGCYSVFAEGQAVAAYFDDGSVAVIPVAAFKPVTGV